jgi:SAM domain (Sterile alpha motif)
MTTEEWLQVLGLQQYAAAFAENDIDFFAVADARR